MVSKCALIGQRQFQRAREIIVNHKALLSLPVLVIIVVAALDSADKGLLASSFPMLEKELKMDVKTLGYFSLFTNLSYSLSMPFWGWLVHKYTIARSPDILAASCMAWGLATIGIAVAGGSVLAQAILRSVNGAAVASIMPLSQTMLVEFVPKTMLGRAFGLMGLAEKTASTVASSSIIYFDDWQTPHCAVGLMSIVAAVGAQRYLIIRSSDSDDGNSENEKTGEEKKMTLGQIVRRIAKVPAFLCLVAQGVFGGIPWDMMSFVLLLLEWRGFTKEQIVSIQVSHGIMGTIGTILGGTLGDIFAYNPRGRICVAFSSIVMGIFAFGMFLFAETFAAAFFWKNLFHLIATWTPAAALRPICAELAQNPSERAQIVSMWILLEKTSAAVFGAPLVGYLTSGMIDESEKGVASPEKASALAHNLFFLSTLFWVICGCFWLLMAYFIETSVPTTKAQYSKLEQEEIVDLELTNELTGTSKVF